MPGKYMVQSIGRRAGKVWANLMANDTRTFTDPLSDWHLQRLIQEEMERPNPLVQMMREQDSRQREAEAAESRERHREEMLHGLLASNYFGWLRERGQVPFNYGVIQQQINESHSRIARAQQEMGEPRIEVIPDHAFNFGEIERRYHAWVIDEAVESAFRMPGAGGRPPTPEPVKLTRKAKKFEKGIDCAFKAFAKEKT